MAPRKPPRWSNKKEKASTYYTQLLKNCEGIRPDRLELAQAKTLLASRSGRLGARGLQLPRKAQAPEDFGFGFSCSVRTCPIAGLSGFENQPVKPHRLPRGSRGRIENSQPTTQPTKEDVL